MQLAYWAVSLAGGILAGIVAGPLQARVFAGIALALQHLNISPLIGTPGP